MIPFRNKYPFAENTVIIENNVCPVDIKVDVGTGFSASVGMMGAEAVIGGKRYYEFRTGCKAITDNLDFEAQIKIADRFKIGASFHAAIDPFTNEKLAQEGYAGYSFEKGRKTIGWNALPKQRDVIIDFNVGGYAGIGGEIAASFNVSEIIRRGEKLLEGLWDD